jgi:hypothetical protein
MIDPRMYAVSIPGEIERTEPSNWIVPVPQGSRKADGPEAEGKHACGQAENRKGSLGRVALPKLEHRQLQQIKTQSL